MNALKAFVFALLPICVYSFVSTSYSLRPCTPYTPANLNRKSNVRIRMSTEKGKLLLLGGTGFVGGEILSYATSQGYKVVAVSRRGVPPDGSPANPNVDWRKGNAVDPSLVPTILSEGGFTGVVHAVGMLFEGDINRLASGSGSVPTPGSTYDDVTRKTALNALAAVTNAPADRALPFAFVSAAEARWTFDAAFEGTPAAWLRRYLVAKRAVEDALLGAGDAGRVRPIIVRPSLVWTWSKPGCEPLPPTPFYFLAAVISQ
jgi:nucleoside-diphosphate-sugar epimerase